MFVLRLVLSEGAMTEKENSGHELTPAAYTHFNEVNILEPFECNSD